MNALCELTKTYGPLIGRVLLALIFVIAGVNKLTAFTGTAVGMAAKMSGLPMAVIYVLLIATIAIELVGGLMIVLGWYARFAAAAIFLFTIPVTLLYHPFWAVPETQKVLQQIMFMKNLAIMGGMLMIAAFGPGPKSLGPDRC
jgi:putative oxidoreductase